MSQTTIRLRAAHAAVAELYAEDDVYAPVFQRLDHELMLAETLNINCPIERARAKLAAQMASA
jgi:hypothetical protein